MKSASQFNRVTPERIFHLNPYQVFVFGSNLSGFHGAGAAKTALEWGAIMGVGKGLSGQTYALPTKSKDVKTTLSIEEIQIYVQEFIEFAKITPTKEFLVTEIGCGLAGLTPEQVAPLFKDCLEMFNVWLPERFIKVIKNLK